MDSHETTSPLMIEFLSLTSDVLLWVYIICYTSYHRPNVTIVTEMNQTRLCGKHHFPYHQISIFARN